MYVFIVESRGGDPPSSLWENSSKRILMVEKIISSVVFIVWGEEGGIRGGEGGVGGNYAQLSGKYNANAAPPLLIQGSYGFKICISFKKEKIESKAFLRMKLNISKKPRNYTIRF